MPAARQQQQQQAVQLHPSQPHHSKLVCNAHLSQLVWIIQTWLSVGTVWSLSASGTAFRSSCWQARLVRGRVPPWGWQQAEQPQVGGVARPANETGSNDEAPPAWLFRAA